MNAAAPDSGLTAVAMSGGVDSSTVAALLHRDGQPIVGMTMQLWNQQRMPELVPPGGAHGRCCSLDDVYDARAVANTLGVPFYVVNFEDRFEEQVVAPFVNDYISGRTPVPCTRCNDFIKFDQFLDMAEQVGAQKVATGHYAQIKYNAETRRHELWRGVDHSRDQSYFLFGLTQRQLAASSFPLGHLQKDAVRELARELNVPVAEKAESHEICFVPNGDYARFVELYQERQGSEPEPDRGAIVTTEGEVLGEHGGVHHYTIGQRKGLGVAVGKPLYVVQIEPADNKVVVGSNDDLQRRQFTVEHVNWISIPALDQPIRVDAKIRHQFPPAPATVSPAADAEAAIVEFDDPQRAITPGQGAVFYEGEKVVGGGWIRG